MGGVGTDNEWLTRVLNAFRHHRGRHSWDWKLTGHLNVLNAFRHHRGRHAAARRGVGVARSCAQRLSASQRSASPDPVGSQPSIGSAQRLSASQRSTCSPPAMGVLRCSRCSTPFGITEVGMHWQLRRRLHVGGRVLNAFRHHRGRHLLHGSAGSASRWVLNAFRHHRGRHPVVSPPRWAPYVLNAFRHHRGRHLPAPTFRSGDCGAQRLSASQRWARPAPRPTTAERRGLSAQRLSASQRSASVYLGANCCAECAQRLSASQRSAYFNDATFIALVR